MRRLVASPLLWVGLFFAWLLLRMEELRPALHWAFPGVEPVIYQRSSFLALFLSHLGLVAAASGAAILVGVSLAAFVTRPVGRDFRAMVDALATVGQTFPPAAVLAIAVPVVGFGPRPTMIALFLYGLLADRRECRRRPRRGAARGARSGRRGSAFRPGSNCATSSCRSPPR